MSPRASHTYQIGDIVSVEIDGRPACASQLGLVFRVERLTWLDARPHYWGSRPDRRSPTGYAQNCIEPIGPESGLRLVRRAETAGAGECSHD